MDSLGRSREFTTARQAPAGGGHERVGYNGEQAACQHIKVAHLASLFRGQVQSLAKSRVARSTFGALDHDAKHSEVVCSDLPVH